MPSKFYYGSVHTAKQHLPFFLEAQSIDQVQEKLTQQLGACQIYIATLPPEFTIKLKDDKIPPLVQEKEIKKKGRDQFLAELELTANELVADEKLRKSLKNIIEKVKKL